VKGFFLVFGILALATFFAWPNHGTQSEPDDVANVPAPVEAAPVEHDPPATAVVDWGGRLCNTREAAVRWRKYIALANPPSDCDRFALESGTKVQVVEEQNGYSCIQPLGRAVCGWTDSPSVESEEAWSHDERNPKSDTAIDAKQKERECLDAAKVAAKRIAGDRPVDVSVGMARIDDPRFRDLFTACDYALYAPELDIKWKYMGAPDASDAKAIGEYAGDFLGVDPALVESELRACFADDDLAPRDGRGFSLQCLGMAFGGAFVTVRKER
jgi:hypothetical protein